MSIKEADRLGVMRQLDAKSISLRRASEILRVSLRQVKRIRKRYLLQGETGVVSKKRGRKSPNRTPEHLKERAFHLLKTHYADFGPTFAQEKLTELHGIILSRETIRKWLIEIGLRTFSKRKQKRTYQRRTRRSRFGEMLQGDGSPHDWFEGRGDKCSLLLFVDDATSRITAGKFFPTETTDGYLDCLKAHIFKHGKPLSIYVDKHSIFRVNREEIKRGTGITHFGKVMKELGIELICAHSPQAKGRVERKNGVLQDRLVKEMRIAGINNIEEANAFLPSYIEKHNEQFGKEPASAEDAHRPLQIKDNIDRIFAWHETRKLSKDLTFQHKGVLYQLKTQTPNRLRFANVDVFWRHGEPIQVEYGGNPLESHIPRPELENF